MARNFSLRPSQLLQIDDECLAFDFDLACTSRLQIYDAEIEKLRAQAMAFGAVAPMFGKPEVKTRQFPEGSF